MYIFEKLEIYQETLHYGIDVCEILLYDHNNVTGIAMCCQENAKEDYS